MKPYLHTTGYFIGIYMLGIAFRYFLGTMLSHSEIIALCFKLSLGIGFGLLIYYKIQKDLFCSFEWKPKYTYLIILLVCLFGMNNFLQIWIQDSVYYPTIIRNSPIIVTISYVISSISEEIIFRGFVQNYLNEHVSSTSQLISKGNFFATLLFWCSHLAFFTIMSPWLAITSLVTVALFSLIAGYLYDHTKNLLLPIALHIVLNGIHLSIQGLF